MSCVQIKSHKISLIFDIGNVTSVHINKRPMGFETLAYYYNIDHIDPFKVSHPWPKGSIPIYLSEVNCPDDHTY